MYDCNTLREDFRFFKFAIMHRDVYNEIPDWIMWAAYVTEKEAEDAFMTGTEDGDMEMQVVDLSTGIILEQYEHPADEEDGEK